MIYSKSLCSTQAPVTQHPVPPLGKHFASFSLWIVLTLSVKFHLWTWALNNLNFTHVWKKSSVKALPYFSDYAADYFPSLTGLPTAPLGCQELPKAHGQVLGCTASQEELQHLQPPLDSTAELNWWFLHNCVVIAIMVGGKKREDDDTLKTLMKNVNGNYF